MIMSTITIMMIMTIIAITIAIRLMAITILHYTSFYMFTDLHLSYALKSYLCRYICVRVIYTYISLHIYLYPLHWQSFSAFTQVSDRLGYLVPGATPDAWLFMALTAVALCRGIYLSVILHSNFRRAGDKVPIQWLPYI